MKVCIDIDDYHSFPRWDCSDILQELLSRFPDIRFTLFFTPLMKKIPLTDYPHALDAVRRMIKGESVEVFPHGLTHTKIINGEFGGLPRAWARRRIHKSFDSLTRADITAGRGFKFPWDLYNRAALDVLEEMDCLLFSHKRVRDFKGRQVSWREGQKVKKRYIQTAHYDYGRPAGPDGGSVIYYHGHAQNMRHNGIRESCDNLTAELRALGAPGDVEFIFCSQLAGSAGTSPAGVI